MRRLARAAPVLALLLWGGMARADELSVRILRYGHMRSEPSSGERDPTLRQDTLSGVVPMRDARIVRPGAHILARYCEGFGIEFQVFGLRPPATAVLLVRNHHPLLTRPDGAQSEEDVFEIRVSGERSWIGFTYAETWSLVPGRWSFTLSQDGRTLAEQAFDVERAPDAGSLEANGCAVPVS